MKSKPVFTAIALIVCFALAPDLQAAQAGSSPDTAVQGHIVPQTRTCGNISSQSSEKKRLFPGHGMNFTRDNTMRPGRGDSHCPGFVMGKRHKSCRSGVGCSPSHCFPCPRPLFGMLLFGVAFLGILNILLTIIVSLDMTKNGRFNGLWIPLCLLAGIPGAIIYALFRIGDRLPRKETA